MIINLKNNKGYTLADIGIAMVVATIFATILTSVFYSVFMSSSEAKKTATALNYAVDIFENIGNKAFADVTPTVALFGNLDDVTNVSTTGTGGIGTVKAKVRKL